MFTSWVFGTTSLSSAHDPFKTAFGVIVIHLSTLKYADGQEKVQCSARSTQLEVSKPTVVFTGLY